MNRNSTNFGMSRRIRLAAAGTAAFGAYGVVRTSVVGTDPLAIACGLLIATLAVWCVGAPRKPTLILQALLLVALSGLAPVEVICRVEENRFHERHDATVENTGQMLLLREPRWWPFSYRQLLFVGGKPGYTHVYAAD